MHAAHSPIRSLALLVLVLGMLPASGWAEDSAELLSSRQATDLATEKLIRVRQDAARLDAILDAFWSDQQIIPVPIADDAEFLRRVSLDLCGQIPSVWQAREFLDDSSPNKRALLIHELIQTSRFSRHFAHSLRDALVPEGDAEIQSAFEASTLEGWLQRRVSDNTRYDQLVRQILTAPLGNRGGGFSPDETGPEAYLRGKNLKAENIAAAASRAFLAVRIECAQCHDHPMDSWKRGDFWGFAVFFGAAEAQEAGNLFGAKELLANPRIKIPDTEIVVNAAFLDKSPIIFEGADDPRTVLADWIVSKSNPYFARAMANRLWGHFHGVGIVDPVDDISPRNPPRVPELLEELARQFAASDFDMQYLIEVIANTKAYQLTSRKSDSADDQPSLFARMAIKGLTAEQVFASVWQATGEFIRDPDNDIRSVRLFDPSPRTEFGQAFENLADSPTERHATVLQALMMMNGPQITSSTDLLGSKTLAAIIDYPDMTAEERVEALFLATLSRRPTTAEATPWVKSLEQVAHQGSNASVPEGKPSETNRSAVTPSADSSAAILADLFWVLLNSSEFHCNH